MYFAQDGAMHGSWLSGSYVPAAKVTRILCTKCAACEVTFEPSGVLGHWHQSSPWKWAPRYGAPCHKCGTDC